MNGIRVLVSSRLVGCLLGPFFIPFFIGACDLPVVVGGAPSPSDTSTGSDLGEGSSASGDIDSGRPLECTCKQAQDWCWSDLSCARPSTCDAITACPEHYACNDGECVCADIEVCGWHCESDDACAPDRACDLATSTCRPRLSCFTSDMCPAGQQCLRSQTDEYGSTLDLDRHCGTPGPLEIGASCESDLECLSGACAGVCVERCRSNGDCPEGLLCAGVGDQGLGCVLPTHTDCGPSCASPEDACASPFPGCTPSCEVQQDCESGRCRRSVERPDASFCDGSPCDAGEFGLWSSVGEQTESLCFLPIGCWTDADCPGTHRCHVPTDQDSGGPLFDTGFCGREPS